METPAKETTKSLSFPLFFCSTATEKREEEKKKGKCLSSFMFPSFAHTEGIKTEPREEGSNVSPSPQLHNFGVKLCLQQQLRDPSGSY